MSEPFTEDELAAAAQVLALPLPPGNDAGAENVREYLLALLSALWREDESFSGKRPFGNSGWQYDIYAALITGGLVSGVVDTRGTVSLIDYETADRLVLAAISVMGAC